MTEILDHAITVRDVLWVWVGAFAFLALVVSTVVVWWLIHEIAAFPSAVRALTA